MTDDWTTDLVKREVEGKAPFIYKVQEYSVSRDGGEGSWKDSYYTYFDHDSAITRALEINKNRPSYPVRVFNTVTQEAIKLWLHDRTFTKETYQTTMRQHNQKG